MTWLRSSRMASQTSIIGSSRGLNRTHANHHMSRVCYIFSKIANHILVVCVFFWQVWFLILQRLGLTSITPNQDAKHFSSWWSKAVKGMDKDSKMGFKSLITYSCGYLEKHKRLHCMFNGVNSSVLVVINDVNPSVWL